METTALDEKINKIKLQNEEIRRRHEEVEADKKNAAKSNALVQMVPTSKWPERKDPPDYPQRNDDHNENKSISHPKAKSSQKEQYYTAGMHKGKVMRNFEEGDGPPPDPKYNFLADSERDVQNVEDAKAENKKKDRSRYSRGGSSRRRETGRDASGKDQSGNEPSHKKEAPEYAAWRAERNRIDQARINRQKTAEGNWRREWDNDKEMGKKHIL